jgi:hypothetical protein
MADLPIVLFVGDRKTGKTDVFSALQSKPYDTYLPTHEIATLVTANYMVCDFPGEYEEDMDDLFMIADAVVFFSSNGAGIKTSHWKARVGERTIVHTYADLYTLKEFLRTL